MPQVSINIANRTYELACGEGEEKRDNDGAHGHRIGWCEERNVHDRTERECAREDCWRP